MSIRVFIPESLKNMLLHYQIGSIIKAPTTGAQMKVPFSYTNGPHGEVLAEAKTYKIYQ